MASLSNQSSTARSMNGISTVDADEIYSQNLNVGALTVTSGIKASNSQVIDFGTNAPICVGTNITGLPTTSLPSNVCYNNVDNSFNIIQTIYAAAGGTYFKVKAYNSATGFFFVLGNGGIGFTSTGNAINPVWSIAATGGFNTNGPISTSGGLTASPTQTINFGSNNPTMGGSNISGLADAALSSNIPRYNGSGTFTGTNTFQGSTVIKSLYDQGITTSSNYSVKISNSAYGTTSATTGYSNVLIGNSVLNNATNSMNRTVAIGESCLAACTSGDQCVAIGYLALASVTTGGLNTAIGSYSMFQLTSGTANFACGNASGGGLRAGCNYNFAMGTSTIASLADNINSCIAMGYFAVANITGNITGNTGIGHQSLNGAGGAYDLIHYLGGSYNTAIGYNSGTKCSANSNRNTFLGATSDFDTITAPATPTIYNDSTAIGYGSIINASNIIKMGRSTETVIFAGNAKFDVNLPTSTLTATLPSQLITKGYGDTNYPTLLGNNGFYGINAYNATAVQNSIRVNTYNVANAYTYLKSNGSIGYTPDDFLTSNWAIDASGLITCKGGLSVTAGAVSFTNPPTMSGSGITGIPDSAITNSGNYAKLNTANTFTVGPTMSGANITGIPDSAITNAANYARIDTTNTFTQAQTINANLTVSSANISFTASTLNQFSGPTNFVSDFTVKTNYTPFAVTAIAATGNLSIPVVGLYTWAAAASHTVTLPNVADTKFLGIRIVFRRTVSNTNVLTIAAFTGQTIFPKDSATGAASVTLTSNAVPSTAFSITIVCVGIGGSCWAVV